VRHEACHLAVGCRLLLLAADRLSHMLIFAAYVHGRLATGLRALADGLWPPLSAVGLRDGHDVNFMNELFTHMTHFASITSSSTIMIRTSN